MKYSISSRAELERNVFKCKLMTFLEVGFQDILSFEHSLSAAGCFQISPNTSH